MPGPDGSRTAHSGGGCKVVVNYWLNYWEYWLLTEKSIILNYCQLLTFSIIDSNVNYWIIEYWWAGLFVRKEFCYIYGIYMNESASISRWSAHLLLSLFMTVRPRFFKIEFLHERYPPLKHPCRCIRPGGLTAMTLSYLRQLFPLPTRSCALSTLDFAFDNL